MVPYVWNGSIWESLPFSFLCLGAGLGSEGSARQYLVIVSASVFISHSVWSLSTRVHPHYITWPCPVPLTQTPYAVVNRDAAVAGVVSQCDQGGKEGVWSHGSRWVFGLLGLPPHALSQKHLIFALVTLVILLSVLCVKDMPFTHTVGLQLVRMFCGRCVFV